MVPEGDWTLSGEHTKAYTGDDLQNYTPETYVMFLPRVTPTNLIFQYLRKIIKTKCPEWLFLIVLVLMIKFTWIETNNVY